MAFISSDTFVPNGEPLRQNLIRASLYLTGFELLKSSLGDRIRDFFTLGSSGKARYRLAIKLGGRSFLENSALWFMDMGALTKSECSEIYAIEKRRNKIAHELPRLLLDENPSVSMADLVRLNELLTKTEVWWIRNVELPGDPYHDYREDEELEIRTGYMVLFDHLLAEALREGSEEAV